MGKSFFALGLFLAATPAIAETVDISGQPYYVTKSDCNALVQYRQAPDVAYQPGKDVHGKAVAPADLPGGNYTDLVPTNGANFTVQVNPMTYARGARHQAQPQQSGSASGNGGSGSGNASGTAQASPAGPDKFANTAMPVGKVTVDLRTGDVTFNGRPLTPDQDRILREACKRAGY